MYVDLEEFVPPKHVLRLIKEKVDFSFVYDKAKDLYAAKGRPSIDPVVLIKMLLVGYLFGISSERQLEQEVRMNLAYRWFLNLELDDPVPDHSTLSQNRRRRFRNSSLFEDIFDRVVRLCIEAGLVTGEVPVTDSTHIKANASSDRCEMVTVEKTPSEYVKPLDEEVHRLDSQLRAASKDGGKKKRGPKPKVTQTTPTQEVVRHSTTDPDSGPLGRPGKPSGYHYLNHMTVDPRAGIITDVYVTPGNVNDHLPMPARIAAQKEKFGLDVKWVGADKGYDYLNVHYGLHQVGAVPLVPPIARIKGQTTFGEFVYDETEDVFRCPAGKTLRFAGVDRTDKVKMYYAKRSDCQACPFAAAFLPKHQLEKTMKRPIHQHLSDIHHRHDGTPIYRTVQRLRRVWCEGTFALMKACHNLRNTYKRGIANVQEQCYFSALAVNLKRYVRTA
jgi:transposase